MASKGPKPDVAAPAAKPVAAKPAAVSVKPESAKAAPAAKAASKPAVAPASAPVANPEFVVAASAPAPAPVITPEAPQAATTPVKTVIKKDIITMETTIKATAEKVQEQAKALFADVNDRTKTAIEKSSKLIEDMNEFSKGNVEAIVESSKIAAKGIETMGQDAAEFSRKHFESATAALKSLSSVKSPSEFFKLQSDYMRSTFDSMVAETSKNTESMLKLAGDVAQPISNRVALAAEKIKIAA